MPTLPVKELQTRISILRGLMRREKLGAVCVSQPSGVHYYSGFTGSDSLLIVTLRKVFLITDFRYVEEANKTTHECIIETWKCSIHSHAGGLLQRCRISRAGFEARHLCFHGYQELKKSARSVRLTAWDQPLNYPRRIKSPWEVRAIQRALKIAEEAFSTARNQIRPGLLETDLKRELEYQMSIRGADGPAFPTIIACGANASRPHAHPGKRKILPGGLVLIDWGARLGHYNSDLTRTLFVDSIPALWKTRYEVVLEAQRLAIEMITSTRTGDEIDRVARSVLARAKIDTRFGHGLGHGVGLEVHEGPALNGKNKQLLEEGSVVTVEPGVYFPGSGGIRIEDMVLVGKTSCTVLSTLPKDVNWTIV